MDADLQGRLERLAEQRGQDGFTFDDMAVTAGPERSSLGDLAEWLAGAHASGYLLDLGYETESDGTIVGPRRYCLAIAATTALRLDLRLPAEPRTVSTMRWAATRFAEAHAARDVHHVELAVSEAVTNAVVHAYPGDEQGDVRLVACAEPEQIVVVVRDWGKTGMRARPDSPGLGIGLPTLATIADGFNIETPDGGGTLLRMHFARAPGARA